MITFFLRCIAEDAVRTDMPVECAVGIAQHLALALCDKEVTRRMDHLAYAFNNGIDVTPEAVEFVGHVVATTVHLSQISKRAKGVKNPEGYQPRYLSSELEYRLKEVGEILGQYRNAFLLLSKEETALAIQGLELPIPDWFPFKFKFAMSEEEILSILRTL